jgi:uncharacterized protein (TIGR00252 family)
MSTTSAGREAESKVAKHLKEQGHKILSLNWRTRWCEIDIVSTKKNVVYFTEVKYRSSQDWGGGLDYITDKKLKQIRFSAEFWLHENRWTGDVILLGVEVDENFEVSIVEI